MRDWRQQAHQGCHVRVLEAPRPGCRDVPTQRCQRQWVRRDSCCRAALPAGQYLHRLRADAQGQSRPVRQPLHPVRYAQGVDVH